MGAFKAKCEHFNSCPLFTESSCAWVSDETYTKFFCIKRNMQVDSFAFEFKCACGVCGSELHDAADCFKTHEDALSDSRMGYADVAEKLNACKSELLVVRALLHASGERRAGAMEQCGLLTKEILMLRNAIDGIRLFLEEDRECEFITAEYRHAIERINEAMAASKTAELAAMGLKNDALASHAVAGADADPRVECADVSEELKACNSVLLAMRALLHASGERRAAAEARVKELEDEIISKPPEQRRLCVGCELPKRCRDLEEKLASLRAGMAPDFIEKDGQ